MRWNWIWPLAALLLSACTTAGGKQTEAGMAGGASPLALVASLPPTLGGFLRNGRPIDYESQPGGTGLGASQNYLWPGASQGVGTVYVYDGLGVRQRRGLPPSVAELAQEFPRAQDQIVAVGQLRSYRVAAVGTAPSIPGPGGQPALACRRYLLALDAGGMAESYLCIGIVAGRFVKLRVTMPPGPGGQAKDATAMPPAPRWEREVMGFGAAAVTEVAQRLGYRSAGSSTGSSAISAESGRAPHSSRNPAIPSSIAASRVASWTGWPARLPRGTQITVS